MYFYVQSKVTYKREVHDREHVVGESTNLVDIYIGSIITSVWFDS